MSEAVVRRCTVKKGVLRNFAKFTGKHLRWLLLWMHDMTENNAKKKNFTGVSLTFLIS